jgi:hypothetical protein
MPGLSKVIVLDPDARAGRLLRLGFEREGLPVAEVLGEDTGLVVVGGANGDALERVRQARAKLAEHALDAPIVFAGRGVTRGEAEAAGADEVVLAPAYLRDVVTVGRIWRGVPAAQRAHVVGNLAELTSVFTLVRALAALGRSATLTLVRGLRRGEIRFYRGEVTSAQVGMIHGQAALHQLLLWTDARFDFHHEDIVRRQQIPLTPDELFADAGRFLEGVRDSSGGLSPAMVLEQDLPRVQSFGKQIPTEVYGVLRMFDGHRVLADVLEDSAYRVFETLRVTQRAVEIGLLKTADKAAARPSWRTVLAIEDWLIGADVREAVVDSGPVAASAAKDPRSKSSKKRRKKKRRTETPVAVPAGAAPAVKEIDWGALVPRIVGAEVGPLAGVVPAAQVAGEISQATEASEPRASTEPKVVFDAAAAATSDAEARAKQDADKAAADKAAADKAAADKAAADKAAAEKAAAQNAAADKAAAQNAVAENAVADQAAADERAAADAKAAARADEIRAVAATVSATPDPARVADDLRVDDTKPERLHNRATRQGVAVTEVPASELSGATTTRTTAQGVAVAAAPAGDISDAVTMRTTAPDVAAIDVRDATTLRVAVVPPPIAVPAPPVLAESAPGEVTDEPSDGVIITHIASAETAPVRRRRLPSDPPEDDRPDDAMGEITAPRERASSEPRRSEPSILVEDFADEPPAAPVAIVEPSTVPIRPPAAAPPAPTSAPTATAATPAPTSAAPTPGSAAATPASAAAEPAPAAAEPKPTRASAEPKPTPASAESTPTPASAELKPAPAAAESKPAPAVAGAKPAPAAAESKPAPAVAGAKPAPAAAESKPAPAVAGSKPAAAESKPAPAAAESKPAPAAAESTPAPAAAGSKPATAGSKPATAGSKPAPAAAESNTATAVAGAKPAAAAEPTTLVADLAAAHSAVSAVAAAQAAAPASPDATSPTRDAAAAAARSDAAAFSEAEEAFFRAGHDHSREPAPTAPHVESFADLDEGYRPVGFWDRLRGKRPRPKSK